MTRYAPGCCKCGSYDHNAHECPQPDGAQYVPEPVATTEDGGDTWSFMCFTPTSEQP